LENNLILNSFNILFLQLVFYEQKILYENNKIPLVLYKRTPCQFPIKFISDNYLQMYKTLQLFTNTFTLNTNILTNVKVI